MKDWIAAAGAFIECGVELNIRLDPDSFQKVGARLTAEPVKGLEFARVDQMKRDAVDVFYLREGDLKALDPIKRTEPCVVFATEGHLRTYIDFMNNVAPSPKGIRSVIFLEESAGDIRFIRPISLTPLDNIMPEGESELLRRILETPGLKNFKWAIFNRCPNGNFSNVEVVKVFKRGEGPASLKALL